MVMDRQQAEAEYQRQQANRQAEEQRRKAKQEAGPSPYGAPTPPVTPKKEEPKPTPPTPTPYGAPMPAVTKKPATNLPVTMSPYGISPAGVEAATLTQPAKEFSVMTNWKPYQHDADGRVISYLDNKNNIFFAPGSTMYALGWREGGKLVEKGGTSWVQYTSKQGYGSTGFVPGPYAGVTIGKYTVNKAQAKKLEQLTKAKDWEGVFQYQKKLGMIQPGTLSPNDRIRLESLMKGYVLNNGRYNWNLLIKDIAEGRTKLSYNDVAHWFGKEVGTQLKAAVKEYNDYKKLGLGAGYYQYILKTAKGSGKAAFNELVRQNKIPDNAKYVSYNSKTGVVSYSLPETETYYINAKGETVSKSVIDDAKKALDKFQKDGAYDLRKALIAGNNAKTNREQLEIIDAIDTLFPPETVTKLRQRYPALFTAGKGGVGESSEFAASVPAPIIGALGFTRQTPIPHDYLVVAAIAGAIWGTAKATQMIRDWKNNTGRNPGVEDMVMLESDKGVTKATFIDPERFREIGGIHQMLSPQVETAQRTEFKPTDIPPTTGTEFKPKAINLAIPGFYGKQNEMVFLPTPADIREAGDNYLMAGTAAKVAEKNEVKIRTDLNNILADVGVNLPARYTETEKAIVPKEYYDKVRDMIQAQGRDITPDKQRRIRELLGEGRSAHNEYLLKKRIYDDARRQFIASTSPQAVNSASAKEALAALGLIKVYGGSKAKSASNLDAEAEELIKELEKVYEKTYEKALAQDLTKTQAQSKANTVLNTAIKDMVKSDTKTDTKPLTKTQVNQLTETITSDLTRVKTTAKEATKTAEKTSTSTSKLELPKGGTSESKKREQIKDGLGGFFYTRGKLEAPVHHVWFMDKNGILQREIIQGAPPEGVSLITGKGSSRTSLRRLGKGKGFKPFTITEDTGASDTILTSDGKTLSISFHGNITGQGANISGPRPRISRTAGRITPKMPKLR
jgi:hypothetical protein